MPYHKQIVLKLRNPDSLEKVLAIAKEKEHFIYFKTSQNSNLLGTLYKLPTRFNQQFQKQISSQPNPIKLPNPQGFTQTQH